MEEVGALFPDCMYTQRCQHESIFPRDTIFIYSPELALFAVCGAVMFVMHTVVVAVNRFRAVFVRAQTIGMCIRDTQLLERTAKTILLHAVEKWGCKDALR